MKIYADVFGWIYKSMYFIDILIFFDILAWTTFWVSPFTLIWLFGEFYMTGRAGVFVGGRKRRYGTCTESSRWPKREHQLSRPSWEKCFGAGSNGRTYSHCWVSPAKVKSTMHRRHANVCYREGQCEDVWINTGTSVIQVHHLPVLNEL